MKPLHELIDNLTLPRIKELLAHLPGGVDHGRRAVLAGSLLEQMADDGWLHAWNQLDTCQRLAVSEAAHDPDGIFYPDRFVAKYGQRPQFTMPARTKYPTTPVITPLCLLLHKVDGQFELPADLYAQIQAVAPRPAPHTLATVAVLPEKNDEDVLLISRETARDALHDVVAMLGAVDQGAVAVSEKTGLPGMAAHRIVAGKLSGGDFDGVDAGPIKAMAWPLLLQASGVAISRNGKLALTSAGVKAMQQKPADTLRHIWCKWRDSPLFDEFNRIDDIKGQKSKGLRMSPTASRRAMVGAALCHCPTGTWIEVDELLRFMRGQGEHFELCNHVGYLYLSELQYGSLAFGGDDILEILQLRYMLCALFEYCATLGMIDVAYIPPHDSRHDYGHLWGADELSYLSRYDGLTYIRLTPLGAYCLGLSTDYSAAPLTTDYDVRVQADLRVTVGGSEILPEHALLLGNWAIRETDTTWRLDRQTATASMERGYDIAQLATFLAKHDSQPLPEQVDSFLHTCNKQGRSMRVVGPSLLIECVDAATADLIANHKMSSSMCLRAGSRHLVVQQAHETAFRKAVRQIGYGIAT